jgi:hypothetical protein
MDWKNGTNSQGLIGCLGLAWSERSVGNLANVSQKALLPESQSGLKDPVQLHIMLRAFFILEINLIS